MVYVEVTVPALGFTTVYFSPRMTAATVPRGGIARDDFIENEAYRLTFENGALATVELKKEGVVVPFTDSLLQYEGRFGNSRSSGAYSFIPARNEPDAVAEKAELMVVKGELVEEARLVYRAGYQEVLRLYRAAGELGEAIEVVHDMGSYGRRPRDHRALRVAVPEERPRDPHRRQRPGGHRARVPRGPRDARVRQLLPHQQPRVDGRQGARSAPERGGSTARTAWPPWWTARWR